MDKQLRELKAANIFGLTGITPQDGGTDFDGYVNVNGPITVNGASDFKGNMKVSGTLDLPAGIIGNDALTDPLVIETSGVSQNTFGVGTSTATFALGSVAVPAGYSRASILCMVVGGALNSTGSLDYLYVSSSINGSGGGESPQPAAAGGYGTTSANGIRTLTGLSGGTIDLGCRMRTNSAAWASNGSNFANMNAVVYFSR
jgi:hypothetical protein